MTSIPTIHCHICLKDLPLGDFDNSNIICKNCVDRKNKELVIPEFRDFEVIQTRRIYVRAINEMEAAQLAIVALDGVTNPPIGVSGGITSNIENISITVTKSF